MCGQFLDCNTCAIILPKFCPLVLCLLVLAAFAIQHSKNKEIVCNIGCLKTRSDLNFISPAFNILTRAAISPKA